ncbi:SPOR domain-containing protein [Fodinibius sediminis]|uniref:Sporulation related domain-containing protein n=1 Tax=Fodinibius sediminis TaxID=1214077 RepID=A0A521F2T5_9BACT|nr:SPOR domain-containing protein [Fodinibius sediminis]SMO90494.1 Sporulation related domain-containing protein [Fodinibius sediminis]
MTKLPLYLTISLLSFAFIFSACSTSRQAADGGPSDAEMADEGMTEEEARALQQLLDENRSALADLQQSDEVEIPSVFTQEASTGSAVSRNPYQGYRIQLVSTRDVQQADTISSQFQEWIEAEALAYNPKAYVFFKQPYYKVHIGDFHSKEKAAAFTQLIKQKYPDAWVVPDRIIPANVPDEDVTFTTGQDTTGTGDNSFN